MEHVEGCYEFTGCVYRKGEEKPVSKWSFMGKLPVENYQLQGFLNDLKIKHGIADRCQELGVKHFKLKASYKRRIPEPDWPKGRLFAIDTQEEFDIALALLKHRVTDYELIVKVVEVEPRSSVEILMNQKNPCASDNEQQRPLKKPKLKGRPNQGLVEEDKALFADMKKETKVQRSKIQEEKFIKFKNTFEEKFPGCTAKSEKLVLCNCGKDVLLNMPRCISNFKHHHLPICNRKILQKKDTASMAETMKKFISRQEDDSDSNASGGADFDEEKTSEIDFEIQIDEIDNLSMEIDYGTEIPNNHNSTLSDITSWSGDSSSDKESYSSDDSDVSCVTYRDSDDFSKDPLDDNVKAVRYKDWDPVCIKLQKFLDEGLLPRDHIFFIYLQNVLQFATDIGTPQLHFHWDPELLEFVETLEYHGHQSSLNLLRGPGFKGSGKGGKKMFDWSTWNMPLPGKFTRKKDSRGYTTNNGIHKCLLQNFLQYIASETCSANAIIENETVKVVPVALQKDGMSLKPGMQVDTRQGIIVGTMKHIDYDYVKNNPELEPEVLKDIFVKEAECYCLTTLDGKCAIPVGVDYIPGKVSGIETKETFQEKAIIVQTCLEHLESNTSETVNGVLKNGKCMSECLQCTSKGEVCHECIEKGHKFVNPAFRACNRCIFLEKKCIKVAVLLISMDSESRNMKAQDLFIHSKEIGSIPYELHNVHCIPDAVHVGKRISRHFSNWFLVVNGGRINRLMLRTLRTDPQLKSDLRPHLSINSCRNRDRMDVQSVLEICSPAVQEIIADTVVSITETLVPEKYRVVENNKRGVLSHPAGICIGPHGSLYVSDSTKGKVCSLRLHYPVEVTEITSGLDIPLGIIYHNGILYICEHGRGQISYVDIKGDTILNPENMTCAQLRKALSEKGIVQGVRNLKKEQLQSKLKSLLDIPLTSQNNADSSTQFHKRMTKHMVKIEEALKSPTAVEFDSDDRMYVSEIATSTITIFLLQSDSRSINAKRLKVISVKPAIYSFFIHDRHIYTASSDTVIGGITCYRDVNDRFIAEDILCNQTIGCKIVHGIAPEKQITQDGSTLVKIIFTDVGDKKVKELLLETNQVGVISGTGSNGCVDGCQLTAQFSQPTSICCELLTIFLCDTAVGQVNMITPGTVLVYSCI